MPQNLKADFLYGLATGIGSLPYREVTPALDLIQETLPWGPHWPQLPQRAKDEGFVQQYLNPLFELGILATKKGETPFFVDHDACWPEKSAGFYELYFSCLAEKSTAEDPLSFFAFSPASAAGFYKFLEQKWGTLAKRPCFLKGQVAGPLSLGLQLMSGDQTPAFYHDELRGMITKALDLNIRFQVRSLKKLSLPVVIFIDEPLLFFYGQQAGISLSRAQIGQSLAELVAVIAAEGAYAGVHCCAGADWSILFELSPHIVSFDAYSYFDSLLVYSAEAEAFLRKGGCLAWGLVPTMGGLAKEDVSSLQERFFQGIRRLSRLGVSADLLAKQYLLTPSCGAATLSLAEGEQIYRLTYALQKLLRDSPG